MWTSLWGYNLFCTGQANNSHVTNVHIRIPLLHWSEILFKHFLSLRGIFCSDTFILLWISIASRVLPRIVLVYGGLLFSSHIWFNKKLVRDCNYIRHTGVTFTVLSVTKLLLNSVSVVSIVVLFYSADFKIAGIVVLITLNFLFSAYTF